MKKMNKLGVVWGSILVIGVVVLVVLSIMWKNGNKEFKKLENKISEAAQKYKDAATIEGNSDVKITLDELKNANLIRDFKANDKECEGYVLIQKKGMTYQYKGYVKCDGYTTKGYK